MLSEHDTTSRLSIIVPIFNEEDGLDDFFGQLFEALARIPMQHEVICVNDGSYDQSLKKLISWRSCNPSIKIVDLSRNFGKEIALTAGIDFSSGDAVAIMDADLQHPPKFIQKLIDKWKEGYDDVYAIRYTREDETITKRLAAKLYYKTLKRISDVPIPPNAGDFRLLDRRVVDALRSLPERTRFMKGIYAWVGFKQIGIPYKADTRVSGDSKLPIYKLWNLAIEGIVSFSSLPLKLWVYIGFIVALASFVYGFIVLIDAIISGSSAPGIPSILTAVFFFGGIQLISIGVLGEYISRIFVEVKQRPIYIINNLYGLSRET